MISIYGKNIISNTMDSHCHSFCLFNFFSSASAEKIFPEPLVFSAFPIRLFPLLSISIFSLRSPKPFLLPKRKHRESPVFPFQPFFRSKKGALKERLSLTSVFSDQISSRFLMIFPSTPSKTCISSSDTPL